MKKILLCFLPLSISYYAVASASSSQVDEALLGLWAKNVSYCQTLKNQGDLTKLNPIFDSQYIYFEHSIFYSNADTPYFVGSVVKHIGKSGTIRYSYNISEDISRYQYSIEILLGRKF